MFKGYFGPFIKTVHIILKESSPSLDMPYCMAKRTKNYLENVYTMYPILPLLNQFISILGKIIELYVPFAVSQ